MNSVELVREICKERKIPISRLEKDLGFSNGYIGQLKKGSFPADRLKLIADYLNVSTEVLLTGDIGKAPAFSAEALEMFKLYEKASPEVQLAVMAALKAGQRKP